MKDALAVELVPVGDKVGFVLPPELLARLKIGIGDTLFATEASDGLILSLKDPQWEQNVEHARAFVREFDASYGSYVDPPGDGIDGKR